VEIEMEISVHLHSAVYIQVNGDDYDYYSK